MAKCLTPKFPYSKKSVREKVTTAKSPYGDLLYRRNVLMAKCPFGEKFHGEMTLGKKSYDKKSGHVTNTHLS